MRVEDFLLEDVYDYLFENDASIGTRFLDEFPDAYIDGSAKCIVLEGSDIGKFKVTLERITE